MRHLLDDGVGFFRDGAALFVRALAQVFAKFALAALQLLVQLEKLALALGALRLAQGRHVLFQGLVGHLEAGSQFLHGFFARAELFGQLGAGRFGQPRFVINTFAADPGDLRLLSLRLHRQQRTPAQCDHGKGLGQGSGCGVHDTPWSKGKSCRPGSDGRSETGAHLELEALQAVRRLGVQRFGIAQLERAHR